MAQEVINTGTLPNDGKGDTLRIAGQKINNNFFELFNVGAVTDNTARQRANAAFDTANTKIAKAGDIVTGQLIFRTDANNAYPNTRIGNIQEANSIDVFAGNENDFAQLNWSNTNFAIVDSTGVVCQTSNTAVQLKDELQEVIIVVDTNNWAFGSNGRILLTNTSTAETTTLAPGFRNAITVTSNTHNASNTNDILFCNPSVAGGNVVVNLSANVDAGKCYTIKNINPGGYSVNVSGTERAYPYIEDPDALGNFVTRVRMSNTGEVYTWVFDSEVYRYIQ
jgi:hypothetical protein